jgi:hypothetical protein
MKNSELLREAKKYLWDGCGTPAYKRTQFICVSVLCATGNLDKYKELSSWIKSMLYIEETKTECPTYDMWLERKHPEIYYKMEPKDFQVCRHQWLDWMITYWEMKGN